MHHGYKYYCGMHGMDTCMVLRIAGILQKNMRTLLAGIIEIVTHALFFARFPQTSVTIMGRQHLAVILCVLSQISVP